MADFLFKIFIKDYENTSDEHVRVKYGILGGAVGIFLNIILSSLKIFAGIISASVSVTADALNNLSDALSSVITLIGFKMSGKPADKEHPFGHGRIEYISALFVSIAILLMGAELVRTSFEKIFSYDAIVYTPISVFVLVISILVKLWMFLFNKRIGVKIASQSMAATAKDSLSDSAATFAVLIGIIVFKLTGYTIDGYIGLVVAGFIFFTGYQTIRDSLAPLLGQAPSAELVDEITDTVTAHEGILGMHDLIIHNYGPTRFMLSLHAEVSAKGDVLKLHDTIDLIERELKEQFKCDAVIHMDPIETDNEAINRTKKAVVRIIEQINPQFTMHDFRMVSGHTHTNLIFDLVVPYDCKMSDKELKRLVQKKVTEANPEYYAVINIDKNYV